jgi:predicted DsbA family dithiol-disulfide isomerase
MRIDVFHDTACPWCRIGKQHLKLALAQWDGEPVTVHYHAYFLNPAIPPAGYRFQEYMHAKGGGRVPLEQWFTAPREMGARAGVIFNFEKIEYAPNTLLSHCLIAAVPEPQRESIIDAVYAAYFEHGRNIGDLDILLAIAHENGIDPHALRPQLETETTRENVLADAAQAQQLGITGVPFFIFNQRLAFSGAQSPITILSVLEQTSQTISQEAIE